MADPFADLVARLDTAMVVVTAADGDEVDGCLVGFHSQFSIDPPRYVVWLSVENRTYRLASSGAASHLAVHVIGSDQMEVAERFGGETGDEVDKLADVPWHGGPGGVPLVEALPERFAGRILERIEVAGGDHVAFVLEPELVDTAEDPSAPPLRLSRASEIDPGHPA